MENAPSTRRGAPQPTVPAALTYPRFVRSGETGFVFQAPDVPWTYLQATADNGLDTVIKDEADRELVLRLLVPPILALARNRVPIAEVPAGPLGAADPSSAAPYEEFATDMLIQCTPEALAYAFVFVFPRNVAEINLVDTMAALSPAMTTMLRLDPKSLFIGRFQSDPLRQLLKFKLYKRPYYLDTETTVILHQRPTVIYNGGVPLGLTDESAGIKRHSGSASSTAADSDGRGVKRRRVDGGSGDGSVAASSWTANLRSYLPV